MRLSPQDPQTFAMEMATAWGHFFLGRDDEASDWAESALRRRPDFLVGACVAAAAAAHAGRTTEAAARAMEQSAPLAPQLRLSNLPGFLPFRRGGGFRPLGRGPAPGRPAGMSPTVPSAPTIRRAGPSDALAVRELTRQAYAKWVPVIGREPTPMTADYERIVRVDPSTSSCSTASSWLWSGWSSIPTTS